jgi:hypothetical protein
MRAPAPIQPLCSTGLDAVVKALEELQLHAPKAHAPRGDQPLDFDYERLERHLPVFLGPQPSQEDLLHLSFSFANVMTQLAKGEPLSPAYLTQNAPIVFPFGLRNAARMVGHLTTQRMHPPPWGYKPLYPCG